MTIAYALDVADAERCFLFVVDELNGTLVLVGNNSENSNQKQGIALLPGLEIRGAKKGQLETSILGTIANQRCLYLMADVHQDTLYNAGTDRLGSTSVRNVMCFPLYVEETSGNQTGPTDLFKDHRNLVEQFDLIEGHEGPIPPREGQKMVAMLYFQNKRERYGRSFDTQDVKNLAMVLRTVPAAIRSCQDYNDQKMLTERMQGLVRIAERHNVQIADITVELIKLSGAQRGTIFCVDDTTHEIFFSIDTADGGKREIRMPLNNRSIAGAAITDSFVINIPDCYQDPRFNPKVDRATGFRTKQMLCVPVLNQQKVVVGAIQVINNLRGQSFNVHDITLLQGFSVYVVQAIQNMKMMKNMDIKESVEGPIAKYIAMGMQMGRGKDLQEFLDTLFQLCTEVMKCASMAIYIPDPDQDGLLLRFDSLHGEGIKSTRMPLREGSMIHTALTENGMFNVSVDGPVNEEGWIPTTDVVVGTKGDRKWVSAIDEVYLVGRSKKGDVHLTKDADVPMEPFELKQWRIMLFS